MTLRFVIGRAGSGKSSFCLEEIRRELLASPDGYPLVLLVPEQASFLAEHALISTDGIGGLIRAQVLSFRRMAYQVLQETGASGLMPVDEVGKTILLSRILEEKREQLLHFRPSAGQTGMVEALLELIREFKRYDLSPGELERLAGSGEPELSQAMRKKLGELAGIYAAYERATDPFLDADDVLALLAERVGRSNLLRGARVWIDGFHGFTPRELAVILSLLGRCRQVTVTLCLDRPYEAGEQPDELDLFYPTASTMSRLLMLAREAGCEVEPVVELGSPALARFRRSPMLAHLEKGWEGRLPWNPPAEDGAAEPGRDIMLRAAMNRRAELEGAAAEMLRLVREEGYRWRDLSVIVRDIGLYQDQLTAVLDQYGIPYFLDHKRPVAHHPLPELIRSALEAVQDGWRYDSVFRFVKTGFLLPLDEDQETPLTADDLDELENYVLAYGIHGHRWTGAEEWTLSSPDSLEAEEGPENAGLDRERQSRLHQARMAVVNVLLPFERSLKRARTVKDFLKAVFDLLESVRAAERLERMSDEALSWGAPEKAREHLQVWDGVIHVIDQMAEVMGDCEMDIELFTALLMSGLDSIRLGMVPPSLDQVLVGSVDRTRTANIRCTFILGVNDGYFPQRMHEDGLLSETERDALVSCGVELAPGSRRKLLDEAFLIYTALTAPGERLWLSYPIADEEGKALLPSEIVRRIRRMFPRLEERFLYLDPPPAMPDDALAEYIQHPERAFSLLFGQLRSWLKGVEISPVWWDVYNWMASETDWRPRLFRQLFSLFYENEAEPLTLATSRKLYGERLTASVSRMERFSACPFSHFAAYGLRLKERRVFRLEAPDIGQLFHAALSRMAARLAGEGLSFADLSPEQCRELAEGIVDELIPRLQGQILLSTRRYAYIGRKLARIVGSTSAVLGEHARRGKFRPYGLEIGFGRNQELPPLQIPLDHGMTMEIGGRIDRVDVARLGEDLYVRILDYKSSRTMLRLSDVYHGLALQLLTYMEAVLEHAEAWLGQPAKPAGVLYVHVHEPLLQKKNAPSPEAARQEAFRSYQMKGLVSSSLEAVRLMDELLDKGARSDIIPVGLKKDGGFYAWSAVVSEEQWEKLRAYVRFSIRNIGKAIADGTISIAPYRSGTASACAICPYRSVCQFDLQFSGNRYQNLPALKGDELWNRLTGDGDARDEQRYQERDERNQNGGGEQRNGTDE